MKYNRQLLHKQLVPVLQVLHLFEGLRRSDGRPISDEEFGWALEELFPEEYKPKKNVEAKIRNASAAKQRLLTVE